MRLDVSKFLNWLRWLPVAGLIGVIATAAIAQSPPASKVAVKSGDEAQMHAMAKATIKALGDGSLKRYLALHISPAKLSELTEFRESGAEVLAEQTRRFKPLLRSIKADGVDLATAKLIKVWRRRASETRDKYVIIGEIVATIGANGRQYELVLDDVLDLGQGWVIGDRVKWFGAVEPGMPLPARSASTPNP